LRTGDFDAPRLGAQAHPTKIYEESRLLLTMVLFITSTARQG
jgi:hypothetical protein